MVYTHRLAPAAPAPMRDGPAPWSRGRTLTGKVLLATAGLSACAPALDWRDVQVQGSALKLQFPCRPDTQERVVALAGVPVRMTLRVCSAGGQTWGLIQADVADPARVGPALRALQEGAAANIGARPGTVTVHAVPGATPQPGSGRMVVDGQLPEGGAVRMQLLLLTHGTQVFQASVLGPVPSGDGPETFFDSLRVAP